MAEVHRLEPGEGFTAFVVPKACSGKAKCSAKAVFSLRKCLNVRLSVFQTVEDGPERDPAVEVLGIVVRRVLTTSGRKPPLRTDKFLSFRGELLP